MTTPTNEAPTRSHDRTLTRSWSRYAETSTMTTGAKAPISATSATVVALIAVNPSPMSAANRTPPKAHARNADHVIRRLVTRSAIAETPTPVHNRHIANVGPDRSLHLTSTGPHAQMKVASHTAPTPRRSS